MDLRHPARNLANRLPACQHTSGNADMKILLVEDSPVERHRIGNYLAQWDLKHHAVANGTQAVKLVQSPEPPDLVLLDWLLPGLDGIEVCRKIRELGTNRTYIYTVML